MKRRSLPAVACVAALAVNAVFWLVLAADTFASGRGAVIGALLLR